MKLCAPPSECIWPKTSISAWPRRKQHSHCGRSSKPFTKNIGRYFVPLLSLPASWEVFCTTFANSCRKLNLDETIGQVLKEDIRRKSMGLTIDESAEAHNSTKSIDRFNRLRKQAERTGRNSSRPRHWEDRQRSKSRNSRSSVFHTHCRKIGHDVSDC